MPAATTAIVRPARTVHGVVRIPGDKSISHRYAMLAAIARGTSRFHNFSAARDCASTLGCVGQLGAQWKRADDGAIEVIGVGPTLNAPSAPLDCGNSGSTMRMLSGILAGQPFTTRIIRRRIALPPAHGPHHQAALRDGRKNFFQRRWPPSTQDPWRPLKAIHYKPEVASAQVKSCVLFAGLFADGETIVEEPIRTRDHGELALRAFGAEVERHGNIARIRGGQHALGHRSPRPRRSLQRRIFSLRRRALPRLPGFAARHSHESHPRPPARHPHSDGTEDYRRPDRAAAWRTGGAIEAQGAAWKGGTIAGADTAALIDEIPVLAAVAPYSENGLEVRDGKELRVKESDRIAAVATNLRKMGAEVEERPDGLRIPGRQKLHGAEVDSFGDHRIAMAFAVAALRAEGETPIHGADAAGVSYPTFFDDLRSITG